MFPPMNAEIARQRTDLVERRAAAAAQQREWRREAKMRARRIAGELISAAGNPSGISPARRHDSL